MRKPKSDDPEKIQHYKTQRKAIAARYYQRHREIIKVSMMLDISMKQARAIARNQGLRT
jgi:hypothetical protein